MYTLCVCVCTRIVYGTLLMELSVLNRTRHRKTTLGPINYILGFFLLSLFSTLLRMITTRHMIL